MPKTRRQQAASKADEPMMDQGSEEEEEQPMKKLDQEVDRHADEERNDETFSFEGKEYNSYILMVDAKRKRNQDILEKSGLLEMSTLLKDQKKKATQRGIARKRKAEKKENLPSRKSNRLAGVEADGRYVEHESGGKLTISGTTTNTIQQNYIVPQKPEYFKHRINDGSDLTIQQAVELCEPKWINYGSTATATKFFSNLSAVGIKMAARSPTSVIPFSESLAREIRSLSINDDRTVAKVTPDRIYIVAAHPSPNQLVVCAGDKQGYVGLWNVDDTSEGDGVHLFHVHSRPVSCLSWTPSGLSLLSASYDGSVRWLDVETQKFQQIFATYDDSVVYQDQLGRGLDQGYNYWTQYVCPDHRNAQDQCFFLCTSFGTAMHVDLRAGKGRLTFHEELSAKKINTLSLHANGYSLASAGLDCCVHIWDIRKFQNPRKGKSPTALSTQHAGKSVNSAFFSPSGSTLLSTTMSNTLELTNDAHLANETTLKPTKRVRHDNHTGRWLCTFMAQWHPSMDIFVVGSMKKPRAIELFDSEGQELRAIQGESLTAVASRCCFHPSQDKLILVGGNSSGRVTVVR